MHAIIKFVVVLICAVVVFLLLFGIPLTQWIEYRIDVKKYGKEIADELARK